MYLKSLFYRSPLFDLFDLNDNFFHNIPFSRIGLLCPVLESCFDMLIP